MGKAMERGRERGRKEIVIYICCCWLEILCPKWGGGGGPSERFMDYTLRIFLTVFLCDDIFPLG